MRVAFASNHVACDFQGGALRVDIVRDDAQLGVSRHERIFFSVPRDYRVHNDCVAAALMTLVGATCPVVSFNFPISERCAELLTRFYRLEEVGPVARELEPRRPGRQLALNFSGGTDSTALYLLLRAALGDNFKVVTADFGGRFTRERRSYGDVRRDVTCQTDLRQRGFDRAGRFLAAMPLLFADYLDLGRVASGHTLLQENVTIASRAAGRAPDYRAAAGAYHAGGLDEAQLVRSLSPLTVLQIILQRAPERLEPAFAASAARHTEKYHARAILVRGLCRAAGLPVPWFLRDLPPPTVPWPNNPGQRYSLLGLWALKHEGAAVARTIIPDFDAHDFSYLDDLSLDFLTRYNTNVTHLIPADLRPALLREFHADGVYPYTERDWHELAIVRRHAFDDPQLA
jgi:hypothetical protein